MRESPPASALRAPERHARLGPVVVVADVGATERGALMLAFDPMLRRDVWIHQVPPGEQATSAQRCEVSRIGRLHWLAGLNPERGRFRAFLLASLKHFLANDFARRQTLGRGGGVPPVSLTLDHAEERYAREPVDVTTPELLYERRWALTVVERVLSTLRQEWRLQQREHEFEALRNCLLGTAPPGGYAATAASLGTSERAVKTAVHRLRRQFRTQLRQDIAETVSAPDQIEEEIRYLIRALSP